MSSELFNLIENRKFESLLQKIERDPSIINTKHSDDYSLIHSLAETAPLDVFEEMINFGANINEQDNYGETPFCWAVRSCNFDVAKYLISKGVEINIQNSDGHFPIHAASLDSNSEAIDFLIENGVPIDQKSRVDATALHYASGIGNIELIKHLLGLGANINAQDDEGRTSLDWASSTNTVNPQAQNETIEFMLKAKANEVQRDRFSCTIMHPRLFPTPITDPFNPRRVKIVAVIDPEKLSFYKSFSKREPEFVSNEPFKYIENITIQHLSVKALKLEVLKRSLTGRIFVVGMLFCVSLFSSHDFGISVLVSLSYALLSSVLLFLINGVYKVKNPVTRFHFSLSGPSNPFYLEVEPENEPNISQLLLSAGLKFREERSYKDVWECEACGMIIAASAIKCPYCGAEFED